MNHDTIVALATNFTRSALSVLRISGQNSFNLAKDIFKSDIILPRKIYLGSFIDLKDKKLDQVTYVLFKGPYSYTGEDILEITCHGNPLIVNKIIQDLLSRGLRMADPGEFTKRAFLNGKIDLCQAEAVLEIINARSEQALDCAEKQLSGELSSCFSKLSADLLDLVAQIEAIIDFPEDVSIDDFLDSWNHCLKTIIDKIDRLIATKERHRSLQDGLNVVIIGEPNVGKSSLLNAFLGEERAIVNEKAGTTRDFITEPIVLEPFLIRLTDTAGIRETNCEIEQIGVLRTLEKIKVADCLILMLDKRYPFPKFHEFVLKEFDPKKTIIVNNKTDLYTTTESETSILNDNIFDENLSNEIKYFDEMKYVSCNISLKNLSGFSELKEKLKNFLHKNYFTDSEENLMVNLRHSVHLESAQKFLYSAINKLNENSNLETNKISNSETNKISVLNRFAMNLRVDPFAIELIASDLRSALNSIGEIVGEFNTESILDRIFSKFCIGK